MISVTSYGTEPLYFSALRKLINYLFRGHSTLINRIQEYNYGLAKKIIRFEEHFISTFNYLMQKKLIREVKVIAVLRLIVHYFKELNF